MHPAAISDEHLLAACEQKLLRRGGPGGQHRNKVETAVSLTHRPTGIQAEAYDRRSQADNRRMAIYRLRLALATQHRSANSELLASPSERWLRRSANGRIRVAVTHDEYPALLAELLDGLSTLEFEMTVAAAHFRVTASQLTKLLRDYPPALQIVNAERLRRGWHKLS